MSRSGSRSKRQSSSRAAQASYSLTASAGPSSSRPFLSMLNPMNSQYHGYTQANQAVPEENEEYDESAPHEDVDLESGRSTIFHNAHEAKPSRHAQGKRRVAWDPGASEMSSFHPNIHKEDKMVEHESSDDEVPQSFKVEPTSSRPAVSPPRSGEQLLKPESRRNHALYTSEGRKLPPSAPPAFDRSPSSSQFPPRPAGLDEGSSRSPNATSTSQRSSSPLRQNRPTMRGLDEYEKALWNWVNVYNLDAFLQEVYAYYEGKGIYSIALSRGLNLLTVGFVIGFSTFLLGCIDYSSLRRHSHSQLSDVIVPHCVSRFSGFTLLFFLLFIAFYIWQIISFVLGIQRLVDMYKFYTYLLKIPDADIQTIAWSEVVRRIGAIREENPLTALSSKKGRTSDDTATAKLDAHDIANRIMRQENYLIALFNKELLDLRVPLPAVLKRFIPEEEGKGKMLTQALEWNLRFCLMEYLFDQHGKVRKVFLKSKNRTVLIEGLKRRFIFMGILNAIFAPLIVLYYLMYSFFRYFEQYHKDPSTIGSRRYTPFAQWKFREFNELPHIFVRRLDESYPIANMYIDQFPNEKIALVMRFVAFIAGSFAAVLVLATLLDPELFINFEITPHRNVFFYLGVFTATVTVARGMIPEDNRVFDPELLMSEVVNYTHYMPDHWKGQLHSKKVHQDFGELFSRKVLIFLQEIVSVILTPFILWFSLPSCAPAIVDFFREFSVHVDGRGYVCSFAEFNFERHGNVKFGAPGPATQGNGDNRKMLSNEGKMEKSFLNFKAANPDWNPADPSGSLYLSRMADLNAHLQYPHYRRRFGAQATYKPEFGSSGYGLGHEGSASSEAGPAESGYMERDRAHEYDQAMRHSRMAAAVRKRAGVGASMVGMSTMLGAGTVMGDGGVAASVFGAGEIASAPSVVLGDSRGSVQLAGGSGRIAQEDVAADGGVGSGLGESYVDGSSARRAAGKVEEEEDEGLEDGGVLGLLAQIYGRRDGGAVVM
ncbi:Autophagy-related protein 9 [Psilocybe cubensis]|uniref:Autophagy-related protein 9 n=2 Tax=Psilocybe cubensis TaxID=181762 RepID=A0A8H7Y2N5_PSICU|nr:Autophagy-related protein 9 [Psilocybe cubensis]KAH9483933.1 Autophagy-related protein 9 [Psilocybe cubensis]